MATSVVFPRVQFFANNGRPLIGGRIHTYVAGSSTRARTYKDAAKAQPNANPIILDARGEASVYLAEGVEYKFVIEDSTGALIMTQEPVYGAIWPNAAEWPSDATLSYQYMTDAKAAASAIGPVKFYDTKAQADAAIGTMANGDIIEVAIDETRAGARTRYKVQAGALVFVVNLDQVRVDLAAATGASLVGFQQAGTGAIVRTAQDKMRELVSVKDFGAVGDGVADDTSAIQSAVNSFGSGGVLATANGGTLYFPPGVYKVSSRILIEQTGLRVLGAGPEATKIVVSNNLAAGLGVFAFDQIRSDYSQVGVAVENLRINMGGFSGHGVLMRKAYDGVTLTNVIVDNVSDGSSAFVFSPDSGVIGDTISQTVTLINCLGIHKNASATSPLFKFEDCQECVLINCKGFGTYESNGKAACYPFLFDDCRGITLTGCSSAFASLHGIRVQTTDRPSSGFLIENHTFETIDGALSCSGGVNGDVKDITFISPRVEGAVTNISGAIDLNQCVLCHIDANSLTVNIDSSSKRNSIFSEDASLITDLGVATSVIGYANEVLNKIRLIAAGTRVASKSVTHLDSSDTDVKIYASGAVCIQADYPFAASDAGMLLAVNRGGSVALSRVYIGGADSAGVGFRALCIANG